MVTQVVKCPQCSSQRVYKDGIRYTRFGECSDTCAETVVTGFHAKSLGSQISSFCFSMVSATVVCLFQLDSIYEGEGAEVCSFFG
jgi:hypothetical protein